MENVSIRKKRTNQWLYRKRAHTCDPRPAPGENGTKTTGVSSWGTRASLPPGPPPTPLSPWPRLPCSGQKRTVGGLVYLCVSHGVCVTSCNLYIFLAM